jgi:pseudouridine 5'-phosphatase
MILDFALPERPLKAVAFDLDGLMVNTEDVYIHVGSELCARRGKTFDDDLRNKMMGQPSAAALAVMIEWHSFDDSLDELVVESDEVFWQQVEGRLQLMPGLVELLDAVDLAGIPKAIATSGARDYADELLTRIDLHSRFEMVITSGDIHRGKPDPEIYLLAARRFGIEPPQMLVLEDSQNGCRAGIAAGAYTVAVPSEHTEGHDYTGAAFIATSLADPRIRQVLAIH